jgi:hypothetical protein
METVQLDSFTITLDKEGSREYAKVSYPIRYGRFSEIRSPEYLLHYNLNGEIKCIQGRTQPWPDPSEWLKRTVANDWVYYSAGGYSGVYDFFGEYYMPYLSYQSNGIDGVNPFENASVQSGLSSWQGLPAIMKGLIGKPVRRNMRHFLQLIAGNDAHVLDRKSRRLHAIIGGRIPVLPPDTRHVDYEIIPLIVADGCLYNCGFCRVKTGRYFRLRSRQDILRQIRALKGFYGKDLGNYGSVFLGQHDALNAGRDLIEFAAGRAYDIFGFQGSYLKGCRLFLFGSVDSLLRAPDTLFDSLNGLPYYTYINIGLESVDQATMEALEKPTPIGNVIEAFSKMLEVNRQYERIEVTANFLFGDELPSGHIPSLIELAGSRLGHSYNKGALYLSPLMDGRRKARGDLIRQFNRVKIQMRMPIFMYLIQRL